MEAKEVCVELKQHTRVVKFSGGREELGRAIRSLFGDILSEDENLVLQVNGYY